MGIRGIDRVRRGFRLVIAGLATAGIAIGLASAGLAQTPTPDDFAKRFLTPAKPAASACDNADKAGTGSADCDVRPLTHTRGANLAGLGPDRPARAKPPSPPPKHLSASSAPSGCIVDDAGDEKGANLCVTFALNSATLTEGAKQSLDSFAIFLRDPRAPPLFLIEGFTDITGDRAKNDQLSVRRAESVVAYLRARGVAASRISMESITCLNFQMSEKK